MPAPKVLLSGLGIPESPRWHDGRLWFANWVGQQIAAVTPDGTAEFRPTPAQQPMGWSIDWLPDGRLLSTGDKLRRQEPDGRWVTVADQAANEIVVDGRGNTYINGAKLNMDPVSGWAPEPGWIGTGHAGRRGAAGSRWHRRFPTVWSSRRTTGR